MPSSKIPGRRIRTPRARLPTRSLGKRVIGIDLATTRCCIASAAALWEELERLHDDDVRPLDVEVFSGWTAAYEGSRTMPITALYYEEPSRLPITGNALDPILKARRRTGEPSFNTERFFRLWKLMFHDDQNDASTKEIQAEIQRKLDLLGMTTDDLLRGWIAATYAILFEEDIHGQTKLRAWDDRLMDLEVVVAVPPGRSVIAHEQVLQAFIQGPIRSHQVSLVSEPEAMFRSWVADGVDTQDWKVGQTYLVCDGGGGTCCLVRFRLDRLDPLGFTQEFESESIICGAETISNDFERLAATMVPLDVANRPWVLDNLRRQFDDAFKLTFGLPGYEEREYCFEKPWDKNSEIVFSCEQIAACFADCVRKLVNGIRHQLQRGRSEQSLSSARSSGLVDCLVLGGGLFGNPYVMRKIRSEFPSLRTCELSKDFNSKKHVARGAVLTRLYARNDFISSRPILRSKALVTWIQVDSSIRNSPLYDLLDIKVDKYNGVEYFYGAQWLVKQGDETVLKHADDIYEISSESSFETARTRAFSTKTTNLEFSETVLTVNYYPGDAKWAALRRGDNKLIDQNGNLIPNYDKSDKITWDPQKFGVSISGLEVRRHGKQPPYKVLRYSFQMQLREVGTKYWIKAWSLDNKNKKKITAVVSEATERQALFQPQEISHNLSESRKLGSGLRSKDDPTDDLITSMETQQPDHQESLSLGQSHRIEHISSQVQVNPNIRTSTPIAALQPPTLVPYPENLDHGPSLVTPATSIIPTNPRKRIASTEGARQPFRAFSRSPLNIRPTKRQSTESNSEYSLGAQRNNGGCWTCAFRNLRCEQGKPECPQCSKVGVVCEYGRPVWWYDDKLKEQQKETNKQLIKNHKARLSSKGQSSVRSSAPRTKIAASFLKSVDKTSKPGEPIGIREVEAQQSRSFQPNMTAANKILRVSSTFANACAEPVSSQKPSELGFARDGSEDLYGASPPRGREPSRNTDDEFVRRSNRRRRHYIPDDMTDWNDIDKEEFGIQSESDSETAESQEDYVG